MRPRTICPKINSYLKALDNLVKIKLPLDEKATVNLVDKFNEYAQAVQKYIDLKKNWKRQRF